MEAELSQEKVLDLDLQSVEMLEKTLVPVSEKAFVLVLEKTLIPEEVCQESLLQDKLVNESGRLQGLLHLNISRRH